MRKKLFFLIVILFMPFLVFASSVDDLEKKISITEDVSNISGLYLTNNKIFLKSNKTLYVFNKDGKEDKSKYYKKSFSVVQFKDNELILIFENKLVLINEDMKEIKSVEVSGTVKSFFVCDDTLLVFSSTSSDSNVDLYFSRYDTSLELLDTDEIEVFGSVYIYEEDDRFIIEDYYDNYFYIDKDYTFKPMNPLSDGSYFVHYDNLFYKYDKNNNLIASIDLEESGINQHKFYYYILNDKLYVSSYSYVPRTTDTNSEYYGHNYYTVYLYLLDLDLKLVKQTSISNPDNSYKEYNPANYYYRLYLNNGNIYLYDGSALYGRYSKISEDLSLTTVTYNEAVPHNSYSPSTRDSIREAINDYLDDGTHLNYNISYYVDDEENYFVLGYYYHNVKGVEEIKLSLFSLDNNFKVISKKDLSDWEAEDESLYPDYAHDYPCFNKMYDANIQGYLDGYLVASWNVPNDSKIVIFDKKGNVVKDFSEDIISIHMAPVDVVVKDGAIAIGLMENFMLNCPPQGMKEAIGYDYYGDTSLLKKQILYYDVPFDIYTKTDGNGEIKVSKSSEFSGHEIEFVVTPKDGYDLKEVKVTDANGNVLVFTDYRFTMPSADVTIEAVFIKTPDNPDTSDIIVLLIILLSLSMLFCFILRKKFKNKIKWIS